MSKNSYNPKAHLPAVYISCWLIQIPSSELSHQAKLLYGRLAQWSSPKGDVHRTVKQLAQEIGVPASTIDRTLKELREVGLIETVRKEIGGINHFKFLKHRWMDEEINAALSYPQSDNMSNNIQGCNVKNDVSHTSKMTSPHVKNDVPKIKEIKTNKRYCATEIAQARFFDEFWFHYPRKKDRRRALEIWVELGLDKIKDIIISDVMKRKKDETMWKNKQFVLYAKNYLLGTYWQEEIEKFTKDPKKSEISSTVPAWGAGHPTWDSLHAK